MIHFAKCLEKILVQNARSSRLVPILVLIRNGEMFQLVFAEMSFGAMMFRRHGPRLNWSLHKSFETNEIFLLRIFIDSAVHT